MDTPSPVMTSASLSAVSPVTTANSSLMTASSPWMTQASSAAYDGLPASAIYSLQQIAAPNSEVHPSFAMPPQKLAVSILQAHGLKHLDNFTGNQPYCICKVVRDKTTGHRGSAKFETKRVTNGDLLNPFWGETHYLETWQPGESLQFIVSDEGCVGPKAAGRVMLPSELFFPQGYGGMLQVDGLPNTLLHVIVRPLGTSPPASPTNDNTETPAPLVDDAPQSARREKTLTVSKRSKQCC